MESSRRDLFIDMVVDRFNFKNNQITLSPFHLYPQNRCGNTLNRGWFLMSVSLHAKSLGEKCNLITNLECRIPPCSERKNRFQCALSLLNYRPETLWP